MNCGTIVEGHYCQHCGQENIVPKETFWGLLTHFVYDITHFDGKFFSTIRLLLTKPGFLSKEYIRGRRASYLHPIRMYVFTSAIFFIFFFMLFNAKNMITSTKEKREAQLTQVNQAIDNLEETLPKQQDSVRRQAVVKAMATLEAEKLALEKKIAADSTKITDNEEADKAIKSVSDSLARKGVEVPDMMKPRKVWNADTSKSSTGFNEEVTKYNLHSVLAYQHIQQALPKAERDGFLKRNLAVLVVRAVEDGHNQGSKAYLKNFVDNLLHQFPKMLFVSLPLYALILQLLYVRNKNLFYADHAIYTIHLYCATFIFLLLWFVFLKLNERSGSAILPILQFLLMTGIYFYQYKSMRKFYGQRRGKTILKFILLNWLSLVMMVFLVVVFTALSVTMMGGSGGGH
ncbi:DUF3667 domain-containing protein [Flavihumibacter petaseus]|uniref:DUF3667 domain-containing protein n=1 Tax=Flavihumibacter petaseus NBRC 106054 TaxID=1220578 RepID=A0A0E9N043_9BACT|nr:DUF3667 domain-containing protein [Flavihumibacter petaseus]GAO43153.1 hypothetical protein FPE01S_02_02570 [Flavihumibacter petaseus NBRC 106054]